MLITLLLAVGAAAHLQLPLTRPPQARDTSNHKRQVGADLKRPVSLYESFYPYAVDVAVGTPGQPQSLALTFSYPTSFVMNRTSCDPPQDGRMRLLLTCDSGSYDDSASSSYESYDPQLDDWRLFKQNGHDFYDVYASTLAAGTLMTETLHVGGASVTSVRMGVANDTTLSTGFLGLGRTHDKSGSSLLDQMADQGIIASRAFSIWPSANSGNVTGGILFGAVDKSMYAGKLQRLQASAFRDGDHGDAPGYAVNVTSAEGNGTALAQRFENFYATVSPTTLITNLPRTLAEPIWAMANATYRLHWEAYAVDCNATASITGNVTLELGGAGGYRLNMALRDLVVPPEAASETGVWNMGEDEPVTWCYFGVQSADGTHEFWHDSVEPWVIGALALGDTYTVFDDERMEVGLAPLRSDGGKGEDIEEFKAGKSMPDSEAVGYRECFGKGRCDEDGGRGDDSGGSVPKASSICSVTVVVTASIFALLGYH